MPWDELDGRLTSQMIMDGNRVVGSVIKAADGFYHVEILWGPGDFRFVCAQFVEARGYVRGVEAAFERMPKGM